MSRHPRRSLSAVLLSLVLTLLVRSTGVAQPALPVPAAQPGTVTLPLVEYDRLVDLANRPAGPIDAPPIPAVVARAELTVRATAGTARGTLVFTGEVFRAGLTKVRLVSGVLPLGAQLAGGTPVALLSDQNAFWAIVTGPGPFVITMPWAAGITTEPGRARLQLPTLHAASIRATIEVAGENADARVEPGVVARRASSAGTTTLDVTLDPGTAPQLSWSLRDGSPRVTRDTRMTADVKTMVTLAQSDVRLASLVDVTITQGTPAQFEVDLPPGFEFTDLTSGSAEVSGQAPGRVTVTPRDPTRRRHQFLVTMERASGTSEGGGITLPALVGAQRETGEIAVEGTGTLEVTGDEKAPLHRMDPTEASTAL